MPIPNANQKNGWRKLSIAPASNELRLATGRAQVVPFSIPAHLLKGWNGGARFIDDNTIASIDRRGWFRVWSRTDGWQQSLPQCPFVEGSRVPQTDLFPIGPFAIAPSGKDAFDCCFVRSGEDVLAAASGVLALCDSHRSRLEIHRPDGESLVRLIDLAEHAAVECREGQLCFDDLFASGEDICARINAARFPRAQTGSRPRLIDLQLDVTWSDSECLDIIRIDLETSQIHDRRTLFHTTDLTLSLSPAADEVAVLTSYRRGRSRMGILHLNQFGEGPEEGHFVEGVETEFSVGKCRETVLRFSDDGCRILSAFANGIVQLRESKTLNVCWENQLPLEVNGTSTSVCEISPTGKRLLLVANEDLWVTNCE